MEGYPCSRKGILVYTRGMYETDMEWLEQRQARLRTIFAVGQDKKNNVPREWKLDGLEYKKLDDEIEMEKEYLTKKFRFGRFQRGQQVRRGLRTTERETWQVVDDAFALAAKHSGIPTRFIGKWQVRVK